ncbi:MAG: Hsp20 family protein [Christensenellales bacterium]
MRRERYYGSYTRSFNVKGIDTEAITAAYNDGVLTLTMPKKEPEVPAARRLEIK